ncbi:CHAT domain-containing protein [Nostoc commune]|uniref:CHAT domain-containing protein n=1 Tax=Nostoc commune TaxID=1178 RepID=UPI0015E7F6AE|nr:CHAT domain-containing protein [Nostoc commune]
MPIPEIPKINREKIKVERFIFKGNTVLSTQQLESVVASYTGREITFSELLEARTAVTKLYTEQGYLTSGAFFPVKENQAITASGGVVTIQIVEGKLEKINVMGSARLQNYIRERLQTNTTEVFNSKHLLTALQLLQTDPLVEKISTVIDKGSVLDSYFQNLPIDMLHDGKKYLTDSYSIVTASSFKQLHNNSPKFKNYNILIGGISKLSPSLNDPSVPKNLPALPEVKVEIENIKKSITSVLTLIDSDFNSRSFQQKFEKNSFSLVHLSTHAQFSSDPEQTFVLAWDKPLNVKDLKFLLKNESDTINLLVLSACQTAKGDKRSALGIAGIAVQAGARSTLASLWLVDADSTALLMEEFYKGLKNGLVLPEALRLAKLSLLSSEKYFHPYYWAGFILVGN